MKPETKFWQEVRKKMSKIRWTRIENISVPGVPDLLGCNKNHTFFTVELKVTTSNKIRFSPHQIAFHMTHPLNSFILVKHLASSDVKLYEGQQIEALAACGLELDACCLSLEACSLFLEQLGAWSLRFEKLEA